MAEEGYVWETLAEIEKTEKRRRSSIINAAVDGGSRLLIYHLAVGNKELANNLIIDGHAWLYDYVYGNKPAPKKECNQHNDLLIRMLDSRMDISAMLGDYIINDVLVYAYNNRPDMYDYLRKHAFYDGSVLCDAGI